MKNIKFAIVALIIATFSSSCIIRRVPMGQPGGIQPMQPFGTQQGQGQRSLKPFYPGQQPTGKMITGQKKVQTGTKKTSKFIGGFTVQLWNSEDMALKQQARVVTEKYFRENGHTFPSDEYVSEQIGHKCRLTNKR